MLAWTLLVCVSVLLTFGRGEDDDRDILHLHFLVPLKSSANSVYHNDGTVPAAIMAQEDINSHPDYLTDYRLEISFSDTQCNPSEGTWQMIQSVLNTSDPNTTNVIAFVGGGCSTTTEPTAALSGRLYKVVQVSYGAASPILSNREMYPLFYRTYPSENMFNDVHFALMKKYNWCIVATLHQTVNLFSLAVTDFHERFNTVLNGSRFSACQGEEEKPILFSFTGDPEIPLRQIQSKDVRIIFGYFYEDKAVVVMCYAKHMGLTGDKYLWILPGWYTDKWFEAADTMSWSGYMYNCTGQDIKEAIDYSLTVDFNTYPLEDENYVSLSGYTTTEFKSKYQEYLSDYLTSDIYKGNSSTIASLYETLSYDAIWSLALALDKTDAVIRGDGFTLADFEYSQAPPDVEGVPSDDIVYDDTINNYISYNLSEFMGMTDFKGVSGDVRFNENGDRTGYSVVFQYQLTGRNLVSNTLGYYSEEVDGLNITLDTELLRWKTGQPPSDRSNPENITTPTELVIAMNIFVGMGIVLCLVVLVFNTVTIRKPLIKNSAPLINTIIIIGCLILMCTCVLLGIDSGNPRITNGDLDLADISSSDENRYANVCMARLWLLTIGFTLSFGALFTKTWQVYRVYTNIKLKEKPFKMWNFLIIMSVLLLLDILYLSIWTGLYPFRREIEEKIRGNTDDKVFEYCTCDNFSYLIGALYVYKGLLAIFGLFLAYESRNVKYLYLNDSRFVSITMYIVVILIGISAPISLVLSEERLINETYGVAVFIITLACTSCVLILYIPKFYYMAKGVDTMMPKTKLETFTPVDKLQLGRSEVNPEDIQNVDKELKELKEQVEQVEQGDYRTQQNAQLRRGSDQDSGVHCTTEDPPDNNNSPTNIDQTLETNLSLDGGECGEAQNDKEAKLHDICEESDDREIVSKC